MAQSLEGKGYGEILYSGRELDEFSSDKSPAAGNRPLAVARPRNAAQLSKLLKFCNANKLNAVARGAGSSLTGASVPKGKSIVIDMSAFNKILEVNVGDKCAVVQPGVVIDDLNRRLSKFGYFYPPDPGSSSFATIGGSISTNAGGLRAVRYGTTKEWVLGLEVVLPTGKIIQTGGRVQKRSIGYDLTGLIVGSEGTLGVITKAILKIQPKPEAVSLAAAYYKDIDDAGRAIAELNERAFEIFAAEFVDRAAMDVVSGYAGMRFPVDARYMLFVQIGTYKESLKTVTSSVLKVLEKQGAIKAMTAYSGREIEKLYAARKYIFTAMKRTADKNGQSIMIADSVVPVSKLPSALDDMQAAKRRCRLQVVLFGHIGDGNIHANIVYSPANKKEVSDMERLQEEFARIAIKYNGSVSGEHGIGLTKKKLLKEEFSAKHSGENILLMKKIKKAFDPNGILNRGKIFD